MEFITLTTGATVFSPRSEVGDVAIRQISRALDRDGKLWAGWSVEIVPQSHNSHGIFFIMSLHDLALSRCCVWWQQESSDVAWELVSQTAPDNVVLHRPRGVPWLAVEILPAYLTLSDSEQMMELGDAERCVAWTLIERAKT